MIKKQAYLFMVVAALFLCCICVPVHAAILEVTMKGTVLNVNPPLNTITIDQPQKYGCSFSTSAAPSCSFSPMSVANISGFAPDGVSLSSLKAGDPVIATSLGGAGGNWITLAKLYGSTPDSEYATRLMGNPGSIRTPLAAGYAVETAMAPDCSACKGTTCMAQSATVIVKRNGAVVREGSLLPGQEIRYGASTGSTDGSAVDVVFRNGKASSASCPGTPLMTGPQPIGVFEITVTPPPGYVPTPMPATVSAAPAPVTTAKSAMLPFATLGAVMVAGLVLVVRRR